MMRALAVRNSDRRVHERRPVEAETTVRDLRTRPHEATLYDLSADGCRIETILRLRCGDRISIGLAGVGRRDAEVVRNDGPAYGCRFSIPLTASDHRRAFTEPTIVDGGFATLIAGSTSIDAVITRWPAATRLAMLLGLAVTSWTAIIHVATKIV